MQKLHTVFAGGGQLPNLLQEVEIPVITEQRCDERWQELDYDVISDIHVCVWDEVNQDKGSCNVSPLMLNDVFYVFWFDYHGHFPDLFTG